jgi:hypothetical protein
MLWQRFEPILIFQGLKKLTSTLPSHHEVCCVLYQDGTVVVVAEAKFHRMSPGSCVSGANQDAATWASELPERLNSLRSGSVSDHAELAEEEESTQCLFCQRKATIQSSRACRSH